ncbi:hypothetical protein K2X14_16345 [Acetobacter sp. TBRC 12305]|uniref:Uncharacterized protein n=1 Tax=Acetobacter garciniae TaxID=2817435 RepID=A0A939KR62_9PROT|nr:hypothetical protein [Acetobacter garciniae]MBO1326382.1 hypothetical protein [Acetobacter garciniae]MBX0346401.1 hypothetical protein [Acetobacter garciniae]
MSNHPRPLLRLKKHELLSPDEDRKMEVGVYDALLPCRKYEVAYKVAVLGKVSQSLEFLLRLVKAVPGITEETAAAFFGFEQAEISYVLNEATGPGFVEWREGRLWLTSAGEMLFREGTDDPVIYTVEERCRDLGFDLLAIAPQAPRAIDSVELTLPELPITDPAGTGRVGNRIFERFNRFFYELVDRRDREQIQQRDLYSVDRVVPKERFQVPVRVQVFAQASAPSLPEIDLSAWRAEHEISDRPQIESAAAMLVDDLKVNGNQISASQAYEVLVELAPNFLKEFVTKAGLNVNRYWRDAVGRAGEPRADRKTVPIIGPLYTEANARRFLEVVDYGLRGDAERPEFVFSVAPQTPLWGASTQQRDTLSYLRRRIAAAAPASTNELRTVCLFPGKAAWFIDRTFDEVLGADYSDLPPALEIMIVPHIAVAALVHAPIGAASGYAVPLGWASFDESVVARTQAFVTERFYSFVREPNRHGRLIHALHSRPESE